MIPSLKRKWRALKARKPGERFQSTYDQGRRDRKKKSPWVRAAKSAAALIALVIGVVLSVLPGPAFVFFGVGGVLLASEFRPVAQGLDWLELHGRHGGAWAVRRWKLLSGFGRLGVTLLGAGGTAAVMALAAWVWAR